MKFCILDGFSTDRFVTANRAIAKVMMQDRMMTSHVDKSMLKPPTLITGDKCMDYFSPLSFK
jgi:hypothetical protein